MIEQDKNGPYIRTRVFFKENLNLKEPVIIDDRISKNKVKKKSFLDKVLSYF